MPVEWPNPFWLVWKKFTWRLHVCNNFITAHQKVEALYSICYWWERWNRVGLLYQQSVRLNAVVNQSYNKWPEKASLQLVFCAYTFFFFTESERKQLKTCSELLPEGLWKNLNWDTRWISLLSQILVHIQCCTVFGTGSTSSKKQ